MPDRENVIKGLKYCSHGEMQCSGCPYWQDLHCIETLTADALALLKEQEVTGDE